MTSERRGDDVVVTLDRAAEPMAWAVGTMEADVFTAAWHAERVLGSKAAAAERVAVVPRAKAAFVRVWADDGSITTLAVPAIRASSAAIEEALA